MKKEKSRIKLYFHCKSCMSGKLSVGWTRDGIQVFCEYCSKSVVEINSTTTRANFDDHCGLCKHKPD